MIKTTGNQEMKQNVQLRRQILNRSILLYSILLLCLGACAPKHSSYSDFKDIDEAGWTKKNPLRFTPEFADSTASYDLYLSVRHDNYYAFRNLWTFVDYVDANNNIKSDTINFVLADEYGGWHSKGFGSIYQYEMKVKSDIRVGDISQIVIWQGMRKDSITHISNVGISLKPVTDKE